MVEVLLQTNGVVFLVGAIAQTVWLSIVIEQVDFLAEAAQREEELDALVPRHGVVTVILENHHRSLHPVHPENRRILDETRRELPDGAADAALCAFILELACEACAPAYAVVCGNHVDHRGAGGHSAEAI